MALDLLIRNGTLIDGTGAAPRPADVGIEDGRVVALGTIEGEAKTTIDATGLTVTPGFIDIHSHSDYTLLVDPRAVSALMQGVTTEVIGNCGLAAGRSAIRARGRQLSMVSTRQSRCAGARLGEYLDRLAAGAACHQCADARAEWATASHRARPVGQAG